MRARAVWLSVTVLLGAAAATGALPAHARTTAAQADVQGLRAEAGALANSYFAALARARQLDDEIAEAERTVAALEADAEAARAAATARAVAAYRQSGSRIAAVVDSSDLLEASRRARLVDEVNQRDHESYARLRRTASDLRELREQLEARRVEQADAVAELQRQAAAADAKLATAQRLAAEQAAQAAAAARAAAATTAPPTTAGAPATDARAGTTAAPAKPVAPPGYAGTPGTHAQHGDPVLTCLRARESGGNYGIVSSDGRYLGAYQFAQSTWNVAAGIAGRSDLVGVPANQASPYDQDAVAWALLQSQGLRPWGGHCP